MPAHTLWDRITRTAKKNREKFEEEQKHKRLELLIQARSLTFGLQVSQDAPPTWEDLQKQKKKNYKGPSKMEVEKAHKTFKELMERHQQGLRSPYDFEEYMGLAGPDGKGHLFEAPPPETVKTSQEFRQQRREQIAAMHKRLIGQWDRFIEKHGDTPIDQVLTPHEQ